MKTEIRAVELVRRIRDQLADETAKMSNHEIIEYFRRAGISALEEARRRKPARPTRSDG